MILNAGLRGRKRKARFLLRHGGLFNPYPFGIGQKRGFLSFSFAGIGEGSKGQRD